MEGESTRIDADHLLAEEATSILHQAPERPFLRVATGKDLGKEFFLNPGETGVGRSIDNDVILTDIAVSRRHLKIQLSDAGLIKIIDLGSGNGSTVNGERVKEQLLNQGDRIELGETVLVVEIPGAAGHVVPGAPVPGYPLSSGATTDQDAAPSLPPGTATAGVGPGLPPHPGTPVSTDYIPAPRAASAGPLGIPKPWLFAFLAVGGVTVALVGATITALMIRDGGEAGSDTSSYNAGRAAFDAQRWDGAERAFRAHVATHPDDVSAQDYLQRIAQVRRDLEAVHDAEAALEDDPPRPQVAIRRLAEITEDSPIYVRQVVPLKRAAFEGRVAELRQQGLAAAREGDRSLAEQRVDTLTNFADQTDRAEEAIADIRRELGDGRVAVASTMRRSNGGSRRSGPQGNTDSPGSTGSMRSGRPTPAMSASMRRAPRGGGARQRARREVIGLYEQGHFDQAVDRARALGAELADPEDYRHMQDLAGQIRRFKTAYAAANRRSATARQLLTAINLDGNISGGLAYAPRFRGRLVDASLIAADSALRSGNFRVGCAAVRNALRADRDNARARSLSRRCQTKAAEMMARAQRMESSDPRGAANLYRQIHASIAPEQTDTAATAYRRLGALAGRLRDEDE